MDKNCQHILCEFYDHIDGIFLLTVWLFNIAMENGPKK